jgi:hypothetical protein
MLIRCERSRTGSFRRHGRHRVQVDTDDVLGVVAGGEVGEDGAPGRRREFRISNSRARASVRQTPTRSYRGANQAQLAVRKTQSPATKVRRRGKRRPAKLRVSAGLAKGRSDRGTR